MRKRRGFTLIELLIVIVIIGILAAIAIPRLGRTREKSYYKAMASDLRNLSLQQELYRNLPDHAWDYAGALSSLPEYVPSSGVTVEILSASKDGWLATAGHVGLDPEEKCGIYIGTVASRPEWLTSANVVSCTGEH